MGVLLVESSDCTDRRVEEGHISASEGESEVNEQFDGMDVSISIVRRDDWLGATSYSAYVSVENCEIGEIGENGEIWESENSSLRGGRKCGGS